MWIEVDMTATLFLAVGGLLLGLLAYRRGLNPWVWGAISVGVLFLAMLLPLNGLLALLVGGGVMTGVIYMASND